MKQTPLHPIHLTLKAKMAEFAGYDMPIQYSEGVMAEHNWTRDHAGIFDVSHMGQLIVQGTAATAFLENLTPAALQALKSGAAKYSVLMNAQGGMIDDLIITRIDDEKFFLVVNGACKDKDIEWISQNLPQGVMLVHLADRALVALQGPSSEKVLKDCFGIDVSDLAYMHYRECGDLFISRLGYTGEDGFEISMPDDRAQEIWGKLFAHPEVKPVGLAARDSLRLDMGYPLYGHDLDEATTPLEADLGWIMRRSDKNFIGADHIDEPKRKRVGIKLLDKGVAREGCDMTAPDGMKIGTLTSGGFSPTLNQAIGMGYIDIDHTAPGTKINIIVRGRAIAAEITPLPFVEPKTKRIKK